MKKPHIQVPYEKIQQFCRAHHIARLALFGSVLSDHFNASSDIDFLVEFEKKHIPTLFTLVAMEYELAKIFDRKADLRTAKDISPYFRDNVLRDAYKLYERKR